MKTKVYDCAGESLGSEWVNLAGTDAVTKEAVLQLRYLDATIKAQLETAYEMKKRISNAGMNLLIQGEDRRDALLRTFRSSPNSVLFGTDSFWAGVDVTGKALKSVIITKLPFRVPTEPIIEARTEYIDQNGGNSFIDFSLPMAVIKFRQGFGRLIRTKSDKGVIVILDTRALTKRYGRAFLESLPTRVCTFDSVEKMVKTIQSWFLRNTSSVP